MDERAKNILTDLETMRENLLAFADEVWQGINYRDRSLREQSMRALDAYNEKVEEFGQLTSEIARRIAELAHISPEPTPAITSVDAIRNERIIQQLDTATPHSLDEDFIYKRPFGFILKGRAFIEITTWKQLYLIFCQQLAEMDAATFDALPSNPAFISPQDRHAFSQSESAPLTAADCARYVCRGQSFG